MRIVDGICPHCSKPIILRRNTANPPPNEVEGTEENFLLADHRRYKSEQALCQGSGQHPIRLRTRTEKVIQGR